MEKKLISYPLSIILFFIFADIYAQNPLCMLNIYVSDITTDTPVIKALIEVTEADIKIETDNEGNASIKEINPGKYKVRISALGYKSKEEDIVVSLGEKKIIIKLELAVIITGKKVVVSQEKVVFIKKDEVSMQTLKAENISKTAGVMEDAFKVVKTLPGVVSEGDFNGLMYVRGGESWQNLVLVDRIYLGNPYHLGGFTSLINPDIIDKIDFFAGGMPAELGQSLSSVIDIRTKEGNSEKTKGTMDISLLTSKLQFDGPIHTLNGSWLISGRRSYYDLLLNAIGQEDVAAPNYGDYMEKIILRPNIQNQLTFILLQTQDELKVDLEKNKDAKNKTDFKKISYGDFQNIYSFDWKYIVNKDFYINTTIADNREKLESGRTADTNSEIYRYDYNTYTLRQDYTFNVYPRHEIKTGLYLSDTDMDFKANYRFYNKKQGVHQNINEKDIPYDYRAAVEKNDFNYNGYFIQDTWKSLDTTLTLRYGARAEYYSLVDKWAYSPRLNVSYELKKNSILKFAWGHYYQFPLNLTMTSKDSGNPDLDPERADHYIIGFEHLFGPDTMGRIEIYYKNYSELIAEEKASSSNYSNKGKGFSEGFDLYLQRKETKKINGWLTYTYAITKRKYNNTDSWIYPGHDQRHTLSIVGNYEYSPKWEYSLSWKINTGKPYTPIIGTDANGDPIEGSINSGRFPVYHRLDFKVSRHYQTKRTETSVYLDIINLYDTKNVYDYTWDETYSKKEPIYSLPFIPFIGVEVKF